MIHGQPLHEPSAAQCAPGFAPLLEPHGRERLDAHEHVAYGLLPDLTLAYANAAWFSFAAANDGEPDIARHWSLGASLLDAIPEPVQAYFERHYQRVLTVGKPWSFQFPCDSPERARTFRQMVYPLGRGEGLLVVNARIVDVPHGERSDRVDDPILSDYASESGLVRQCCQCRRTQRVREPDRWDWVKPWVHRSPHRTTHGLCGHCVQHAFQEIADCER